MAAFIWYGKSVLTKLLVRILKELESVESCLCSYAPVYRNLNFDWKSMLISHLLERLILKKLIKFLQR